MTTTPRPWTRLKAPSQRLGRFALLGAATPPTLARRGQTPEGRERELRKPSVRSEARPRESAGSASRTIRYEGC